jgi:hypothetical protein
MVHSEVPEFDSTLANLATVFTETLTLESEFVNAEDRLAEDLNDIIARFDVVFRLSEENNAAQAKVKAAREAIERARRALDDDVARGGAKQARLQFELEAAIKAKGQAIQAAAAKLSEYIEAKKKFNRMKTRRLNHGYMNLGDVLEREIGERGRKAEELTAAIGEARNVLDDILAGKAGPSASDAPFN